MNLTPEQRDAELRVAIRHILTTLPLDRAENALVGLVKGHVREAVDTLSREIAQVLGRQR